MKKLISAAILIIATASCTPHPKLWQRCGRMKVTDKGVYKFEPYDDWHIYNPSKPFPDTMFQFVSSYTKPKN